VFCFARWIHVVAGMTQSRNDLRHQRFIPHGQGKLLRHECWHEEKKGGRYDPISRLNGHGSSSAWSHAGSGAGGLNPKQQHQLPTQSGVSHEAAKAATEPDAGSADNSTGAKEQSSAPPGSGAASAKPKSSDSLAESGDIDKSRGAKEQSSAPAGSSAASTSKANPALGSGQSDSSKE
jgi:hypothetical protein